jgi:hypothetical protein
MKAVHLLHSHDQTQIGFSLPCNKGFTQTVFLEKSSAQEREEALWISGRWEKRGGGGYGIDRRMMDTWHITSKDISVMTRSSNVHIKYCGVAPRGRSIERPLLINGYAYLAVLLLDNGQVDSNSYALI